MALFDDPANQIGMAPDQLADEKERGRGLVRVEDVQDPAGELPRGAVVEGQRDHLRTVGGPTRVDAPPQSDVSLTLARTDAGGDVTAEARLAVVQADEVRADREAGADCCRATDPDSLQQRPP